MIYPLDSSMVHQSEISLPSAAKHSPIPILLLQAATHDDKAGARALGASLGLPCIAPAELVDRTGHEWGLPQDIRASLRNGLFASGTLVNHVLSERLRTTDCARGFILFGYPRTIEQALCLEDLLRQIDAQRPIVIEVANDSLTDTPADLIDFYSGNRLFRVQSPHWPTHIASAIVRLLSQQSQHCTA